MENKESGAIRVTWGNRWQFLLTLVGFSVGLGNVWRFPYLCYRNGGGAFLLAYLVSLLVAGIPLFFLEIALGQYTRCSGVTVWDCVMPSMKGVGVGCLVIVTLWCIYNVVVMAWSVYYMVYSVLPGDLAWTKCDNWWNSKNCSRLVSSSTVDGQLQTDFKSSAFNFTNATFLQSPEMEFWKLNVLQQSSGLGEIGTINNPGLVGCFLFSWIVVYFCIFKGTKLSGKIVYVTSTLPYLCFAILLVRSLTLEGAFSGIYFLMKPDFAKLALPQVWMEAGSQIFISYGVCFLALFTFSSFNQFNNNCYRQSLILTGTCCMTSIICSLIVFGILGHMAFVQEKDIAHVATSGPGLVFVVYPVGLSMLPAPKFWSFLFFFTLIFVGIDSQFTCLETIVVCLRDMYPRLKNYKHSQEIMTAIVSIALLLLGLMLLTNGGIYVFELLNMYAVSGVALMWFVFFESVAVGWVYGTDRFKANVKEMIGHSPNRYFLWSVKYFVPVASTFIFIHYCVQFKPLKIDEYQYSFWENALGWMLSLSSMLCVPAWFIAYIWKQEGSLLERLKAALKAAPLKELEKADDPVELEKIIA